ncbi:MAG: hypothetical protein HOP19_12095 [Acidobacteria bacterium]|nr:hypothetical protein [Acidobacteriota bacterium]
MQPLAEDTPPEIERIIIEGYRRMSAAEKLAIMDDLIKSAHLLALSEIRRQHPHASEREWQLRAAARRIEPELMRKAFGWDPDVKGY